MSATVLANRKSFALAALIAVWGTVVLCATLLPPEFDWRGGDQGLLKLELQRASDLVDVVFNIALFMPLGALVQSRAGGKAGSLPRLIVGTAGAAFLFSISIEILQYFLPMRDSSLVDVFSNTIGAVSGIAAWRWISHKGTSQTGVPQSGIGLLVAYAVCVLVLSSVLQFATRPSNWDDTFPLVLGNERTGDRPWLGRIISVDLSDFATPVASINRFAAGDPRAISRGNIASLDFPAALVRPNKPGLLPRFIWEGRPSVLAQDGLRLGSLAWIRTEHPAAVIAHRVSQTGQFTIRLVCATDSIDQEGPARVISYSGNTREQNFLVGQEGIDLVLRFRTRVNGLDGTRIPIVIPGVFSDRICLPSPTGQIPPNPVA